EENPANHIVIYRSPERQVDLLAGSPSRIRCFNATYSGSRSLHFVPLFRTTSTSLGHARRCLRTHIMLASDVVEAYSIVKAKNINNKIPFFSQEFQGQEAHFFEQ